MTKTLWDPDQPADAQARRRIASALGIELDRIARGPAFMRPPQGGLFAHTTPVCMGEPFNMFFATNYPPASRVAKAYGIDVALPLGLTGNESGWGRSHMARTQNNMVGATPNGVKGVTYSSPSSAWQNWGRQWGPRVRGVGGDADLFLNRLAIDNRHAVGAVDRRGPYNTQDPATYGSQDWMRNSRGGINTAIRRLAFWRASGC